MCLIFLIVYRTMIEKERESINLEASHTETFEITAKKSTVFDIHDLTQN